MSTKITQVSQLANYLGAYPYITQLIARQLFQVERLASRVYDLKQQGYNIQKIVCQDCTGRKYTRYSLVK